ncbi:tetratricopeptide repeat protein [Catenuloplanes atrovinosus]|uniref:Tetratricopeptide (TPR) repeat protein n=1 Tax=Catenuloplanes atrovinosus TaxID=137266 RepID=A0AAE3YRL8_9ACTN|nr:tetratricopeptide repeat protein [Catenuloplanes atrovinosus]MDR7277405.1 tetratricopeptide (TPR) repeat protein [Catenuloplanes atrovinosus]
MWRRLFSRHRDGHRPLAAQADATAARGDRLGREGRWQAASAVTAEAVDMYRRLAATDDEARGKLAGTLVSLGEWLARESRFPEAADADAEAVAILRELAPRSAQARRGLAAAVNNAGVHLGQANRWPAAVELGRETVTLMRGLDEEQPGAFTAEVALAYLNLGTRLDALGLDQESLEAKREAVARLTRLVQDDPALLPELARACTTLGPTAARLHLLDEAVAAAREAIRHYRALAAEEPRAHADGLAGNLANLAMFLRDAGRRAEAYAAVDESITVYRSHPGMTSSDAARLQHLLRLRAELADF